MLSSFRASYQRVEQSLQRLTESIASYNPSATAADELLAADEAVSEILDQLVIHQSNHIRIEELRRQTEKLDETLKTTLQLLADTRKQIIAIPSSTPSDEPRRQVKAEDLLAYAKFISKTTVPPTFRKQPPPIKSENAQAQITNGIATPPLGAQDQDNAHTTGIENVGTKALSEVQRKMLDPNNRMGFSPWPSPIVIQNGALGEIQRMVENGQDPASVLTAEEQAELDRRNKEDEEREKLAQEEAERRRMSMFDTGAVRRGRRESVFNPDDL
ncbi:hypothetical protein LTR37_005364 [Vermiconidia calcicola]|uniref:Uncharacterized protein n=1 Tax=Vermiconidia calcicola TaxID=1690605 RepID=A0ACC3NLX9_9PEZI|nr:hypothetical protein LTR37_005364 [Vermiconidia calcicola]